MNAIHYPSVSFKSLCIPEILKEIYLDKVFAKLKPCNVILDVGANIGLTAMYLKDFCKELYAIEPATGHYNALLKNAYENQWNNVLCKNMAIADKNGTARINLNDQNRTMNSLVWYTGKSETVQCFTFAQFMAENHIEEIDFCKLDVEGAEEAILLGEGFTSVAPRIKSLLVEIHSEQHTALLLHMKNLGYNYYPIPANAMLYWFER